MDKHNVKRLWDSKEQNEYKQLRRPDLSGIGNSTTTTHSVNNITNSTSDTSVLYSNIDVAKKSNLSVEAKEWYPPGYNNSPTPCANLPVANKSVQSRLNKYRQPEAKDFKSECDRTLEYLYDIIKMLTLKPGKFDDVVDDLMEHLEPHFQELEIINGTTSAIFNQALSEPNFQYTGARMFAILDANCPLVRACLHSLCEKELESSTNLQNLTIFYAEIYSQLNFELFGKCLLKALAKLMTKPENVKTVCLTLKLSGAKLEALDKGLITEIVGELEKLRSGGLLSPSMCMLVESVVKLRDSQWGQADVQALPPPAEPCEWADGPVFYGPDGLQLTHEESEFLSENLNEFLLDDSDPDALYNPDPEMTEEIQAAFADFVRLHR